jgi:hypothetical protein
VGRCPIISLVTTEHADARPSIVHYETVYVVEYRRRARVRDWLTLGPGKRRDWTPADGRLLSSYEEAGRERMYWTVSNPHLEWRVATRTLSRRLPPPTEAPGDAGRLPPALGKP